MYLNGELAPVVVQKDQLTATILPKGGGAFDPWDGFLFGNRQKKPSVPGGAIDELRIFKRALTPIEVRYGLGRSCTQGRPPSSAPAIGGDGKSSERSGRSRKREIS